MLKTPFLPLRLPNPRYTLYWLAGLVPVIAAIFAAEAFGHEVPEDDRAFIQDNLGIHVAPFIYLGAKHMATGYDHILFLLGIIFLLYKMKDVWHYVSIFAIAHMSTLMLGSLFGLGLNAYLVDAAIGLSVVYKALDNVGALKQVLGFRPNTKVAVGLFGLIHGFGLSTQFQKFEIPPEILVPNLLSFSVGVEIGQVVALVPMLLIITFWRRFKGFPKQAFYANLAVMTAGLVLVGYQLTGFFTS